MLWTPGARGRCRPGPMLAPDLKSRVERHQYCVDCHAVAEAFLARHSRCWNPVSVRPPRPSGKTTSPAPAVTDPTRRTDGIPGGPQINSS